MMVFGSGQVTLPGGVADGAAAFGAPAHPDVAQPAHPAHGPRLPHQADQDLAHDRAQHGPLLGRQSSQRTLQDLGPRGTWRVSPGSGTGALAGLRGSGTSVATSEPPGTFTLDYELG